MATVTCLVTNIILFFFFLVTVINLIVLFFFFFYFFFSFFISFFLLEKGKGRFFIVFVACLYLIVLTFSVGFLVIKVQ